MFWGSVAGVGSGAGTLGIETQQVGGTHGLPWCSKKMVWLEILISELWMLRMDNVLAHPDLQLSVAQQGLQAGFVWVCVNGVCEVGLSRFLWDTRIKHLCRFM